MYKRQVYDYRVGSVLDLADDLPQPVRVLGPVGGAVADAADRFWRRKAAVALIEEYRLYVGLVVVGEFKAVFVKEFYLSLIHI